MNHKGLTAVNSGNWPSSLMNRRGRTLLITGAAAVVLFVITTIGISMPETAYDVNFSLRNQSPSMAHIFGTDFMGRDMLARTVKGLSISILIGALAAGVSSVIALVLGCAAALLGEKTDMVVGMAVNMMTGIPHILLLILISFVCGKGMHGVVIAVALTHWPNFTRIVRAEVMQLRTAPYVRISRKMGRSNWWIARKHLLPHLLPQFFVGTLLLFPHAILHEAGITFLGFGLPLQMPAVGVILTEAMKYLSVGCWWLAFFPGFALLLIVLLFETLGENLRLLLQPTRAHE
ncbi:hypothetical protein P22_3505 [Propionispora sp. 2/2-37]|uniref:ABC transporter permease n=1 Tax=Propionispora sp. 2/2-37 TaxID=1677858 RepID=UPI0006BB88A1|nr:ABC transporter permease [Propionispora sp. 2/2-37]CUH97377.1 hypothetical protein P22_3505 [Propionispora sp. 2/2-37]